MDIIFKLENFEFRREKEQEIEKTLNIPAGHIIIDVPYKDLHQTEPRLEQTDIKVIDKNEIKNLDFYTPVAEATKSRNIPDWALMIVTDENYREKVSKKVEKILLHNGKIRFCSYLRGSR